MKNLVFGGSFDPPHQGHVNLLKNAIETVGPGRVFVIPSGVAPHKRHTATPWEKRADMCECFRPLFPALVISDMEEKRGGKSYTVDTLRALREGYPGEEWYFSLGGDMLLGFTEWHRWQDILEMATLVAAGREGGQGADLQKAADALEKAGGQVMFAPGPVVEASSTALRRAMAEGEDPEALLPPPAGQVAKQNSLYRHTPFNARDARRLAQDSLSEKRYRHTKNVAAAAQKLAARWGADEEKTLLAAWLHDIVKEWDAEALLRLSGEDAIMAGSLKQRPFPVWHGPCAAVYAKCRLGVADDEVLGAMACHTTGKAGMSLLDKVLYLADLIGEDRAYDEVEDLRRLAKENLDAAVMAAMKANIRYLHKTHREVDNETIKALQYLVVQQCPDPRRAKSN